MITAYIIPVAQYNQGRAQDGDYWGQMRTKSHTPRKTGYALCMKHDTGAQANYWFATKRHAKKYLALCQAHDKFWQAGS